MGLRTFIFDDDDIDTHRQILACDLEVCPVGMCARNPCWTQIKWLRKTVSLK